jgi:hypothetical protein
MLSQGWMFLCDRLNIGPDGDDGQSQISEYRSQQSDHRNQLVVFADSSRYDIWCTPAAEDALQPERFEPQPHPIQPAALPVPIP